VLEKTGEHGTRMRRGVSLHVIGDEAREQVAVKRDKKVLEVQH